MFDLLSPFVFNCRYNHFAPTIGIVGLFTKGPAHKRLSHKRTFSISLIPPSSLAFPVEVLKRTGISLRTNSNRQTEKRKHRKEISLERNRIGQSA